MPAPRVSIRIGLDGKATVVKDFGDIGDAGDTQSKRIAAAFQRDAALAEAAVEKLNKTAQKAASIAPGTSGATNLINPITGGSYAQADGAAQASARAMQQQFAQAEASAQRLLASVDPLYAAQLRYNQALEEAQLAYRAGALSAEQFEQVQAGLKAQLDGQTVALGNFRNASGGARIAQMEVMGAARGMTDALAMGMPVTRAVSMELGRLTEAAALMGGGLGAVGEFLSGPWGMALMVGTVALAPFIGKILDTSSALDTAVEKLRNEAEQQKVNDEAHKAFAATLDGVDEALRANREAIDRVIEGHKSAAEQVLIEAFKQQEYAKKIIAATEANLAYARSFYEVQKATASGMGHQAETAIFGLQRDEQGIDALQAQLDHAKADLAAANEQVRQGTLAVYAEAAQKDPVQLIKDRYQGLIDAATKRATAEHKTGDELQRQIVLLNQQRDAAIAAAQARSGGGSSSIGTGGSGGGSSLSVQQAQIASFYEIANRFRGLSETANRSELQQLLGGVDPEKTAWCAAFINAVLAMGGVHGTGSLAADSFLNFGKDDRLSPQKGDIVIIKGAAHDHVGILDSVNANGSVNVLGGNTGNRVAEATYSASSILGIRTPPLPGDQLASIQSEQNPGALIGQLPSPFGQGTATEVAAQQQLDTLLSNQLQKETDLTITKEAQASLVESITKGTGDTLEDVTKMLPGLQAWNLEFERIMASMDEFRQFGDQELETLLNPDNWKNWGDLGLQMIHELEAELMKLALLNPLKNLLLGENNPTLSSLFTALGSIGGSLFGGGGGGGISQGLGDVYAGSGVDFGFASGTESAPGGYAWVGEFGKELVRLPRGSKVYPADQSRRLAAANDAAVGPISVTNYNDFRGADPAAVGAINARLDEMEADLPTRIVTTFEDARARNVIRF